MTEFSKRFTCIALDTPGYGLSDDSVSEKDELWGYTDVVAQVLDAFGLDTAVVYGAATGAQIGVQFARRYPARTRLLVLDSAGHFDDDDIARFEKDYFVNLTPRRDGRHLLEAWDASRHLTVFFPWMASHASDRVHADVAPPQIIQHHVDDMLRAGPNYKDAYWQAMLAEKHANAVQVTVPVLLSRNDGSMMKHHTDTLIAKGLPENFTIVPCTPVDRYAALCAAAHAAAGGGPGGTLPDQTGDAPQIRNVMVDVPGGQLRARLCLQGEGRPLVAIHDPAGSSHLVEPILTPYLGRRPVIAFDNPGNGESDAVIDTYTSETYATVLNAALDSLGVDEADVIGRYSGGPVAMEMWFQSPKRIKHLVQAGVSFYEGDEQAWLVENYTPSIAPRWDGSHLMTAWSVMRDQSLYWPWFNQTKDGILWNDGAIDVALTHLRVVEMLKCGDCYQQAYNAMWCYPMREKLPAVTIPTLLCHPPWEPVAYTTALAHDAAPNTQAAEVPPSMTDWHTVLDPFFDAP